MAVVTWFLTNNSASVGSDLSTTDPGTEAYRSPTTGWVVSTGATNRAEYQNDTEVAATAFANTNPPDGSLNTTNGDFWVSPSAITGSFASGDWTISVAVRAQTNGGAQDGRAYARIFRGPDQDGTSATEVTSAATAGTTTTNLATSATQTSTITVNPGAFSVSAEYIFIQLAWERTGAGGMTTSDVNLRIGNASGGGSRVATADFSEVASGTGSASGSGAASGIGAALGIGTGSAVGTGTASGVRESASSSDGAALGSSSASGVGVAAFQTDGAAAGTGAASAVGAALGIGIGSASGASTATGTGSALGVGDGAASGSGTASGVGIAATVSDGSASGAGTAAAVGAPLAIGDGSAAGAGAASGAGIAAVLSDGAASGAGASFGAGQSTVLSVGAASGAGTAAGNAVETASDGLASGTGTATGVGAAIAAGNGVAAGSGTAGAVGAAAAASDGASSGTSTTFGVGSLLGTGTGAASGAGAASGVGNALLDAATGAAAGSGAAVGIGSATTVGVGSASGVGAASAVALSDAVGGPFFLAWVAPETAFDAETHAVEDLDIFAFDLSHTEGEFATLSVDVVNPRVGLLNDGREQWAWFSWYDGSEVVPLFFGRLVGVPQELQDEVVRLEFIARPLDYDAQKEALAETLKVAPYWDPVWLSEDAREDPDSVLESRTQLWHIDRLTHDVTVSDIVQGEGGTLTVGGDFFYDSLSVSYSTPPGRTCVIKAQAVWQQAAAGEIDITGELPPYIETYSGDGLIKAWPDADTSIGAGWRLKSSEWRPYYQTTITADPFDIDFVRQFDTAVGDIVYWAPGRIKPHNMVAAYEVEREYVETLELTVNADIQALLTDPGDDEIIRLDVSAEVDQGIDPPEGSGTELQMPIRDRKARRYFQTERGLQSVDYLVCLARAQLMHRARAIEIGFEIPFDDGVDLSCRHMATISDPRLPGGEATGKVKSYSLSLNGDTGDPICRVVIGATVGNGGTATAVTGTPSYVEAGVLEDGIQVMTGATRAVVSDQITVNDFSGVAVNDDGVNWFSPTAASVVDEVEVINDAAAQEALLEAETLDKGNADDVWEIARIFMEAYTQVRLRMVRGTGGPFETVIPVGTSTLKIPRQIDLEAEAA